MHCYNAASNAHANHEPVGHVTRHIKIFHESAGYQTYHVVTFKSGYTNVVSKQNGCSVGGRYQFPRASGLLLRFLNHRWRTPRKPGPCRKPGHKMASVRGIESLAHAPAGGVQVLCLLQLVDVTFSLRSDDALQQEVRSR